MRKGKEIEKYRIETKKGDESDKENEYKRQREKGKKN